MQHYHVWPSPLYGNCFENTATNATTPATQSASSISVTVDHPKLAQTYPESTCRFLSSYGNCVNKIVARATELDSNVIDLEATRGVGVKSCLNIEFVNSMIALGWIFSVTSYHNFTNSQLSSYLGAEASKSRAIVTISLLETIVRRAFKIDMKNVDVSSRMRNLFMD